MRKKKAAAIAGYGIFRLNVDFFSGRSASLRAGLRQSGIVHFQQLSGTDKSVP